jgi:Flp pilus assembly pilin Flp
MVMLNLVRDNPIVALTLAFVRTRLEPMRETNQRGASAVEWAVIAAICVLAALAIGGAVAAVVNANSGKVNSGTNLPGIDGAN